MFVSQFLTCGAVLLTFRTKFARICKETFIYKIKNVDEMQMQIIKLGEEGERSVKMINNIIIVEHNFSV